MLGRPSGQARRDDRARRRAGLLCAKDHFHWPSQSSSGLKVASLLSRADCFKTKMPATLVQDGRQPPPVKMQGVSHFDLRTVPKTDPVDIYRVRDGIYAADMLLTAIVHLDLF